ncbi:MAG: HNH endonuclease signature motif containing protein [Pseudomonadota bacterium]
MATDWGDIFDIYGEKEVSATDKSRAAYVPTISQRAAIRAAGIVPSKTRPGVEFQITLLNEPTSSIGASFYEALRKPKVKVKSPLVGTKKKKARTPEARMGHAFISSWLQVGDLVILGVIGNQLFAVKKKRSLTTRRVVSQVGEKVLALAARAKGRPVVRSVVRNDFVRNPFVVRGAAIRSKGKCEMPGCVTKLFCRDDGSPHVEVHHIIPLAEGGDDSMSNVATLCAQCHREQHLGLHRNAKRVLLAAYRKKHPT